MLSTAIKGRPMKLPLADTELAALLRPYRVSDGIVLNARRVLRFLDACPPGTIVVPMRQGIAVQYPTSLQQVLVRWDGATEEIHPIE